MRTDTEVAAHLGKQVAADFLLQVLQGGEPVAEEPPMASLTMIWLKGYPLPGARTKFLDPFQEFAPLHDSA